MHIRCCLCPRIQNDACIVQNIQKCQKCQVFYFQQNNQNVNFMLYNKHFITTICSIYLRFIYQKDTLECFKKYSTINFRNHKKHSFIVNCDIYYNIAQHYTK